MKLILLDDIIKNTELLLRWYDSKELRLFLRYLKTLHRRWIHKDLMDSYFPHKKVNKIKERR